MTRIKKLAEIAEQQKQGVTSNPKVLEIDEMWTFIEKKENEVWVMYLMDRATHHVIDFRVGSRKKENIQQLTDQAILTSP
jgi:hypothetical protein